MICVDSLHLNLNRIMLLAIGLWPYQQSKFVRVQLTLLFSILISCILFQFTAFITLECTPDLVIDIVSSTLFFSIFVIKYSSFSTNKEIVKQLLEELQHIYNELQDENEISIIKKYGYYAKLYTAAFILLSMLLLLISAFHIFWPSILNLFSPKNESRYPSSLLITEYFINKERYCYLIVLHTHLAFVIGVFSMVTTGAIIIVYLQHACGMFRIASYRFEKAMAICTLQKNSLHNQKMIYKRSISAVEMHRKAVKLSYSSVSRFNIMFFILVIVGVICGSLNYFRVFRAVSCGFDIETDIVPMIFIFIHFIYLSVTCYIAQEITDYNNDVFVTVYNIQWYLAPLNVQKMVLFLLQKGRKTFYLSAGGIFVGSLETAATVMSTSISYFTVLYSTRK